MLHELKCERCGYDWFSRVKSPKSCPRCKRYDWEKKTGKESSMHMDDLKDQIRRDYFNRGRADETKAQNPIPRRKSSEVNTIHEDNDKMKKEE